MTPALPHPKGSSPVANPKLGTKRIDPETGRKFYDLDKDPIVSPYTGVAYPRSYFEANSVVSAREEEEETEEREVEPEEGAAEVVSLEDAEEETKAAGDDLSEDEEVELDDDAEDTFLEDEEEEGDGVSGILGVGDDEEG